GHALAAAGLADEAERAAARDREIDAIDRDGTPPAVAVRHHPQVLDGEQRHYFASAASAAAMPASSSARSITPTGLRLLGRNFAKCTQRSRLTASSRSSSTSGSVWSSTRRSRSGQSS